MQFDSSHLYLRDLVIKICRLLYIFTWQLYRSSSKHARSAMVNLEEVYRSLYERPEDALDLLDIRYLFSLCLRKERKDMEAQQVLEDVLERRIAVLAADDPGLLKLQHALAGASRTMGRSKRPLSCSSM